MGSPRTCLAFGVATTLGCVLLSTLSSPDAPVRRAPTPSCVAHAAPTAARFLLPGAASGRLRAAYAFETGTTLSYRLAVDSAASLSTDGSSASRTTQRIRARLDILVREAGPDGFRLGFRLDGCEVSMSTGGEVSVDLPDLARELEQEAVGRFNSRGIAMEWSLPEGMDPAARNLLRGVLSALAFTLPRAEEQVWTSSEDDPTGRHEARYRFVGVEGTEGIIEKRKTYTSLYVDGHAVSLSACAAPKVELEGAWIARFDFAAGNLVTLRGEETSRVLDTTAGRNLVIDGHQETTLDLVSVHATDPLPEGRFVTSTSLAPETVGGAAQASRRIYPNETLAQVLQRLRAARLADRLEEEGGLVLLDLKALFAEGPDRVAEGVSFLLSGGLDASEAGVLAMAMAISGQSFAEEALIRLASDDRSDDSVRLATIEALGFVECPRAETIRALSDIAKVESGEAWRLAIQALGFITGGEATAEVRQSAGEALLQIRPETPDGQGAWLLAVGNAGLAPAEAAIVEALASPNGEMRAVAASALRGIRTDSAASALLRVARADESASVRASAVRALAEQEVADCIPALGGIRRSDADAGVRDAALEALCAYEETDGVRACVHEALTDADEQVRSRAQGWIDGLR